MGVELFLFGVILLGSFAIIDLFVGVSNDAVNFLNSSLGSKVAPRYIVMIIASLGIFAGVTFSSGMMEVARKGIFHPSFFTMPELIIIFLAVMLSDIILLDLFNTYGLPTSTTVSIVFELLGAAVAVSMMKNLNLGRNIFSIGKYINSEKAIVIIMGILSSVVVAFIVGAIVQFFSRIIFTFNYKSRLKRYGALWGGVAMSFITYFIIVKGASGASFINSIQLAWINSHTFTIMFLTFAVSTAIFALLLTFKINIFKPVVLIGTFALAMAFAANDLVNFIGVPIAGVHAYQEAMKTTHPLTVTMVALSNKLQSHTFILLLAGLIMVITLWFSKKAQTVTETTLNLGQQEEGNEQFGSTVLSRIIVRMVMNFFTLIRTILPNNIYQLIKQRLDPSSYERTTLNENRPQWDLLRASVNLMVASALVSFATSLKLPLSTTYVTFMVAMGTSFADRAWGRETAVFRVTGVLTVIGGWFITALLAFTFAYVCGIIIFYTEAVGVIGLLLFAGFLIFKTRKTHKNRMLENAENKIFNLRKIKSTEGNLSTTFEHLSIFLKELRKSIDVTLTALFVQDFNKISMERKKVKKIQLWSNIIIANIFKVLRLLQKNEVEQSYKFAQIIRRLQKLSDGHRDIVLRSYKHVGNQHKGLLDVQIEELKQVKKLLNATILEVEMTLNKKQTLNCGSVYENDRKLRELAAQLDKLQIERIRDETSKTRLTILFYAIVGNALMISKQNLKLLEIFRESFGLIDNKT